MLRPGPARCHTCAWGLSSQGRGLTGAHAPLEACGLPSGPAASPESREEGELLGVGSGAGHCCVTQCTRGVLLRALPLCTPGLVFSVLRGLGHPLPPLLVVSLCHVTHARGAHCGVLVCWPHDGLHRDPCYSAGVRLGGGWKEAVPEGGCGDGVRARWRR